MFAPQEYAKLSVEAYGLGVHEGWRDLGVPLPETASESGFYAAAYQRQGTNEIVIAFRGTEPVDDFWNDIMGADGAIATGREHQRVMPWRIARRTGLLQDRVSPP